MYRPVSYTHLLRTHIERAALDDLADLGQRDQRQHQRQNQRQRREASFVELSLIHIFRWACPLPFCAWVSSLPIWAWAKL